mgnify:CR=1 FL=1
MLNQERQVNNMAKRTENRDFLMADFETSTQEWYEKDGYARVWLWGLYDPYNDTFNYGIDLDSFMENTLVFYKNKTPIIYFHNLKFDGSYIVNWLFRNGFAFDKDLSKAQTFTTAISDMGLWYYIDVCIYVKGKTKRTIRFQDSLKKIPLSVREMSSAFNLEYSKGDLDYAKYRPIGYKPNKDELSYLYRDCKIPALALLQLEAEGFTKMTCASDSFYHWKLSLQSNNAKARHLKPDVNYRRFFPELSLEVDDYIRKAYRGGWTYVNPRYQDKILYNLQVWDINSMYPSKMRNKYLPVGEPTFFTGKPQPTKYQCYICRVLISFEIKKDHLPCIQVKNSWCFNPTEYITSSNNCEIELYLTNIDLNLIFKQYDVKSIKYLDGYYFRKSKGYFTNFIDENMEIKEHSTGGRRFVAKRRMNSVYGKTGTAPRKREKIPYLDEDGVLRFSLGEEEIDKPQSTAIAVFVTSHARRDIIVDAQNNYENFVYCDTDSLHMLKNKDGTNPNLPIHQTHIGYYKKEQDVYKAIFLRSKTYIEQDYNNNTEIKCAGASPEVKKNMSFDNFKVGGTYTGKLAPKQVKGGCILFNTTFTIK